MNALATRLPPAEPHPGGRPVKFSRAVLTRVLRSAKRGLPLTMIARGCGFSTQGLLNYRRANPRFEAALERAVVAGVDRRLRKIEEASETADWRAAAWLLEHCQPEHFAKTRVQVEAVGQFAHSFVVPQEVLDRIAEARARVKENSEQR